MTAVPKFRVSSDASWAPLGGDAPNDGCIPEEVFTALPAVRQLAEAVAIGLAAGRPIDGYAIDFSDAYRNCPVQRADQWEQTFLWHGGVAVERRGVFGARWMPNRFQRIATIALALARHEQRLFDDEHPTPHNAFDAEADRAWRERELAQQECSYAQIYIDDTCCSEFRRRAPALQSRREESAVAAWCVAEQITREIAAWTAWGEVALERRLAWACSPHHAVCPKQLARLIDRPQRVQTTAAL